VPSALDFHDYADEYFGWAETARSERDRAMFLHLAAAWLEVVQQWEDASLERPRSALPTCQLCSPIR
jgi:hypothetical protein